MRHGSCGTCFWGKTCEDRSRKEKYSYDCWKYRSSRDKLNLAESYQRSDRGPRIYTRS